MKIRRYVGASLEEAVSRVKRDLGRDAIILEVRRIRAPGFWGWLKRRRIEVTAAVAQPSRPAVPLRRVPVPQPVQAPVAQHNTHVNHPVMSPVVPEDMMPESLRVPYTLACHHTERLVGRGIEMDLARDIVEQALASVPTEELSNSQALSRSIKKIVMDFFPPGTSGGLTERVIAFVGPTGVGKTTTIAKLAAVYSLQQGKTVALITTDTYRIAAVEQLRRYANILHIPLEVVYTADDLQLALNRYQEAEVILVDTAGRSPQQGLHLAELRNLLADIHDIQTVLVVSATTKAEDLKLIYERFCIFSPCQVVLTKVDETEHVGALLSLVNRMRVPVGLIANGQNVPDDLKVANPTLLANLILGGANHA